MEHLKHKIIEKHEANCALKEACYTLKVNASNLENENSAAKNELEGMQEIERAIQGASYMKCKSCQKLITTQTFIGHVDLCNSIFAIPLDITVCDFVKQSSPNQRMPHFAFNISITLLGTTWYISKRFKQLWLLHKKLTTCFQYNREVFDRFMEATKHLIFEDQNEKMSEKEKAKLAGQRMYFIRDYIAAIVDIDCKSPPLIL